LIASKLFFVMVLGYSGSI